MRDRFCNVLWKITSFVSGFEFTSGVVFVVVLSCVLSFLTKSFNISEHALSLESGVFLSGHVHKLLTYCFYHKNLEQLLVNAAVLVFFCSGLEKGVGTVRFLHLFFILVPSIGLIHVLLELLLFPASRRSSVSGLIPVSLAMLGIVTISSRMKKAFVLGFTLPTAALPWFLMLTVHFVIPNTVFLCNVLAIITGQMYAMNWFPALQMSESRACVAEKTVLFRWLRKITLVHFVPASAGERKKVLHTVCSPSPGSYPVQTYASASSSQATGNAPSSVDGWSHSSVIHQKYTLPLLKPGYSVEPRYECSSEHICGHEHNNKYQARNCFMPKGGDTEMTSHVHFHSSPPTNIAVQSFGNESDTTAQADSTVASVSVLSI